MADKYFHCHEWTPELLSVADELVISIQRLAPELEILFMGAAALKLPGKNDIDLDILCSREDLEHYIQLLLPLLGEPQKLSAVMAIWSHEYKGFEIDVILSDPATSTSHVPEQKRIFEILSTHPALREQYRKLKIASDGVPYEQYEAKKKIFFKELLATQPDSGCPNLKT